jgi:hypothetical protein
MFGRKLIKDWDTDDKFAVLVDMLFDSGLSNPIGFFTRLSLAVILLDIPKVFHEHGFALCINYHDRIQAILIYL